MATSPPFITSSLLSDAELSADGVINRMFSSPGEIKLKAGTWSSQTTSNAFYMRDVTHRHMDTNFTGPAVAAQQVM